ncbi:SH3 domain-containing protein [Dendronalium sp. ChiSLP03b]|uniref:SH3 domain-containing protein n=1 Tax=Dendronalium sp. ChiSLP03b TaxID=3075381 RepID=UPI002AD44951|nr:SH3 domain-containing protein [Dendronalium sp. ChiSLP03b]MDZ8205861.1 SH3 domain-containing protein [Dendronalium sp. ChiSLP03b]
MLSGLLKFILGFFLALAVLIGSGVAVALYFMNRTAIPPAKPIFANDSPSLQTKSPKATDTESSPTSSKEPTPSPSATPSASPTESPTELPPGAYRGRVTWSQGLSLRSEPNQDAERIGGVGFNQKIIVLEESQDKAWQKIRVEGSKQEGWVKVGNTQRDDE